ncbi:MAG: hypothetical protein PHD48_11710 [Alphaproteobacteria bacterium]|nr:hypothetical protein [Alphaproteobacteria bacterium]
MPVPSWLTGEPGPDVLLAPRVVRTPTNASDKTWPNLADVPETKPVFTSEPIRSGRAEEMNSERLKALVEIERLRNIQLNGHEPADTGVSQ